MSKNTYVKLIICISVLLILSTVIVVIASYNNKDQTNDDTSKSITVSTTAEKITENTTVEETKVEETEATTVEKTTDTKKTTDTPKTTEPKKNTRTAKKESLSTTNDSPKYIDKIVVTRMPYKTVYYLGDRFDMTGLQVTGYFTNGAVEDITDYIQYYSEIAGGVSNKYKINIEYTDQSECINLAYTSISVVVKAPTIVVPKSNLTLDIGDTDTLSAVTEATGCKLSWYTTDSNIVQVDDNGNITAVGAGSASVYAVISYNNYKYTSNYCKITVNAPETEATAE